MDLFPFLKNRGRERREKEGDVFILVHAGLIAAHIKTITLCKHPYSGVRAGVLALLGSPCKNTYIWKTKFHKRGKKKHPRFQHPKQE
jgi:hypothetical protein